MYNLTHSPARQLAPGIDATWAQSMIAFTPDSPNGKLGLARELTRLERKTLEERIVYLDDMLSAQDRGEVEKAIALLLIAYPSYRGDDTETRLLVSAYVELLAHLPGWAVRAAVRRFAAGEVSGANSAFLPSAPAVAREAQTAVAPLLVEKRKWLRLLAGEAFR